MVHQSLLNGDPIQIAKHFKQALKQANFPVDQMYVFGSYSKHQAHWDSDLDVAVISDQSQPITIIDQMNVAVIASSVDDMIEPHLLTTQDFNNRYFTLSQEIKHFGISI